MKVNFLNCTLVLFAGLIIGLINGLIGGGGGMICVPLLIYLFKLKQKEAQATTIFVILCSSIASAFVYITQVKHNLTPLWFVIIGTIIGGIVGAKFLKKLNNKTIKYIFAVLLLVAGISLVIKW